MANGELLDLVCGPASPLPETYQRYRLVAHLGSGGQAEVYRAVRLSGGVSSAPMTVKVFRIDPQRPLADELRSWDKGDAVLMDLNNRGVNAICRRADGFYGPPPHPPGTPAVEGAAVPYQVYDYLHGVNLREYVAQRTSSSGGRRLNGLSALRTLAGILRALHHPTEPGATPVLHMDVKASNVMVLANGEVRLIDFTGARYWYAGEITQIAYTPESGGPEAFGGAAAVSPAYDVHGFGAVAYFMVTGTFPRGASPENTSPAAALRRHPGLDSLPALREHLHNPLADDPADRPSTLDLNEWVLRLAELVRRSGLPDTGIDWTETSGGETVRAVGRATARRAVTGTETDAFQRIERLERELVQLRAVADRPQAGAAAPGRPATDRVPDAASGTPRKPDRISGAASVPVSPPAPSAPTAVSPPAPGAPTAVSPPAPTARTTAAPPPPAGSQGRSGYAQPPHPTAAMPAELARAYSAPVPPAGSAAAGYGPADPDGTADDQPVRGRAVVPPPKTLPQEMESGPVVAPPAGWQAMPGQRGEQIKRGLGMSIGAAIFVFVCWAVWAVDARGNLGQAMVTFLMVLGVAVGVFALCRLLGRIVIEQRLSRPRRGARVAHLVTSAFLIAAGVAFVQQATWVHNLKDSLGWLW